MNTNKTFLFYDIETTGLNKCFDQVLQFAAIRTDLNFNELERHEFLIKLNPDVIPAPQALITHQITLESLKHGLCEYEAITKIHQLLNTPGTISVGYNTLGFDDEFLRFSFYRNLLPPYTHQFANNCGRMDIYPIAVLYYLFKPDVIKWPKINDVNSFKLEHLSNINKLAIGNAHEAMTDVEACLALARVLTRETEMWNYVLGYFDKKIDLQRINKLPFAFGEYRQALLIDGSCGAAKNYQCPVLGLGMHNHYRNQSLWLRLDAEDIAKTVFVCRKRFGESPILLPVRERNIQAEHNIDWLQKNPKIFNELVNFHKEYKYPEIPNIDVDAALYNNGFLKDYEERACQKFHTATLEDKIKLINKFTNSNLRKQAIRIIGRNYPELLSPELQYEFAADISKAEVDYRGDKKLTKENALAEIIKLRANKNLSERQQFVLTELENYLTNPKTS